MSDRVKEGYVYTNGKTAVLATFRDCCEFHDYVDVEYQRLNYQSPRVNRCDEAEFLKRYPYLVENIIIEVGDE
jgi:hypothetical protein